jgi:hypothetical protein
MKKVLIGVNKSGRRVGESHPRAVLSDSQVDLMREMHEELGIGYRRLAAKFSVSKRTVRDICAYKRRWQLAERWKAVYVVEEERRV